MFFAAGRAEIKSHRRELVGPGFGVSGVWGFGCAKGTYAYMRTRMSAEARANFMCFGLSDDLPAWFSV